MFAMAPVGREGPSKLKLFLHKTTCATLKCRQAEMQSWTNPLVELTLLE